LGLLLGVGMNGGGVCGEWRVGGARTGLERRMAVRRVFGMAADEEALMNFEDGSKDDDEDEEALMNFEDGSKDDGESKDDDEDDEAEDELVWCRLGCD
jgi:hypothetical protein